MKTPWRCLETRVPTHSRRSRQDDSANPRGMSGGLGFGETPKCSDGYPSSYCSQIPGHNTLTSLRNHLTDQYMTCVSLGQGMLTRVPGRAVPRCRQPIPLLSVKEPLCRLSTAHSCGMCGRVYNRSNHPPLLAADFCE